MALPGEQRIFESAEKLNHSLADLLADSANVAVGAKGRFAIALSGGKTPEGLYTLLASNQYRDKMPWRKTFFFWGDERCVPASDKENNAHMARVAMLDKVNVPLTNIYPVETELAPENAARAYEIKLHDFFENQPPVFDTILLGVGEDGHTASLLPDTSVLEEGKHWVMPVYNKQQKIFRVTMTAPLINHARQIVFIVSGKEKAGIIKELANEKSANKYPAQLIHPYNGRLFWFLDKEAASLLW